MSFIDKKVTDWTPPPLLKRFSSIIGTEGFGTMACTETERKQWQKANTKTSNNQKAQRRSHPSALPILYFYPLLLERWSAAWLSCSSPQGPWEAVLSCGLVLKNRDCCCSFSMVELEVSLQHPDYRTSSAALTASCKAQHKTGLSREDAKAGGLGRKESRKSFLGA